MSETAKRETWRDWQPAGAVEPRPEELLTRDQVLAQLARGRVKLAESDLRYWEQRGALPRPVRRWHEGAVRAVYPPWILDLIRRLRRLQREGYPLAAIGPQLRAYVGEGMTAHHWQPERLTLPGALTREIEHFAADVTRVRGVPAAKVTIVVEDAEGNSFAYPYQLLPIEGC